MTRIHTYGDELNFHNVDVHATQVRPSDMSSVATLIEYFAAAIPEVKHRHVYLARGLLAWMTHMMSQDKDGLPDEITKLLTDDPTRGFAMFCKSADIPHEVIYGFVKDIEYRPGDNEDTFSTTCWAAFKSEETWHLVNPPGVILSITGYQRGGEIVLEADGNAILEEQTEAAGTSVPVVNGFWFCLQPSIFITYCIPNEDPDWQLLPPQNRKSMSDFVTTPYMLPSFFMARLQLLSDHACVLYTKNGRCTVTFGSDKVCARYISMAYKLSIRAGTCDLKGIDVQDLPLLVRYAPGIGTFSFNIRFPVSGKYIFETYVKGPDGPDTYNYCTESMIICAEPDPDCKKLPMDAGNIGYGYGYAAIDMGLKNPSISQPNITVSCSNDASEKDHVDMKEFTFQIEDDKVDEIEFSSDVVGDEDNENVCTEIHVDTVTGMLHVKAGIKKKGEYALSIIARPKTSEESYSRIINYLLTTKTYDEDYEFERRSTQRMKELTLQKKMQELNAVKVELSELLTAMLTEMDQLKKIYEDNKNKKETQTEDMSDSRATDSEAETDGCTRIEEQENKDPHSVQTTRASQQSKFCSVL